MHTTNTKSKAAKFGLAVAALGVVFGDIGTSPLYAIREMILLGDVGRSRSEVLGLISLTIWILTFIISIKYVVFVLRADNNGEGGVFSLFSKIRTINAKFAIALSVILIFAAGLIFGDGVITPAISVLSAVEGIKIITPDAGSIVVPLTCAILFGLFFIQKYGTKKVGKLFGPIIFLWFVSLIYIGLTNILHSPDVLNALNPMNAINFITEIDFSNLVALMGGLMLVVTGGEALFADLGHFGKSPIRLSWFSVAYPALIMCYLGQGAFLLSGKKVVDGNIFFSAVPSYMLTFEVILATLATIIASQALISGAFSLTTQGIALGFIPRLKVLFTNEDHSGQIYIPLINWALFVGSTGLVLAFQSSTKLASAYGLAVSYDMFFTTLAMLLVAIFIWKWNKILSSLLFLSFGVIDLFFAYANTEKLLKGGFIPLSIAIIGFIIMSVWSWGRAHVRHAYSTRRELTVKETIQRLKDEKEYINKSLLVLTSHFPKDEDDYISALASSFIDRIGHLPRHIVLLNVQESSVPYIPKEDELIVNKLYNDNKNDIALIAIQVRFGFMEQAEISDVVRQITEDTELAPNDRFEEWILLAGKERIFIAGKGRIFSMRARLFRLLAGISEPTYSYFGLGGDGRMLIQLIPTKLGNDISVIKNIVS